MGTSHPTRSGTRLFATEPAHDLTIIIAAGSRYRKLAIPNIDKFEGVGIYYGATQVEAPMCQDDQVAVVGGGNSAGQAALFLAGFAKHVHVLVRGPGLAQTMSRYLIARIEVLQAITVETLTTVEALEGYTHLERIIWRNAKTGLSSSHEIHHLFVMTGADANTGWLGRCLSLDSKRFIMTGPDVASELAAESGSFSARNQAFQGSSRSEIYERTVLSEWHRLSAKDQWQSSLSTRFWRDDNPVLNG